MDTRLQGIIDRVLGGDANAFETLVTENQGRVYALALRMVRNEQDALDLSQEAFIRAYRSLGQYRGESSFSVWLYRLTQNICLDFLRKKKKQNVISFVYTDEDNEQTELETADTSLSPETLFERNETRRAVAEGLSRLSEEHRRILALREIDGYSYDEIAEMLSLELGTVKSRIARARLALRAELRKSGGVPDRYAGDERKGV